MSVVVNDNADKARGKKGEGGRTAIPLPKRATLFYC